MNQENLNVMQTLIEKAQLASNPYCRHCKILTAETICLSCKDITPTRNYPSLGLVDNIDTTIRHMVESRFLSVDVTALFEEYVFERFQADSVVTWFKNYDLISPMRSLNPDAYDKVKSNWLMAQVEAGKLVTLDLGISYYATSDLQKL